MAYDEVLAGRIGALIGRRKGVTQKKMFGGLTFLVNGNMACGALKQDLVVRLGPEGTERALARKGTRPMDFTGRPMKGIVYVEPGALRTEAALKKWVEEGVAYARTLPAK